MAGERAGVMNTDPPYGISFDNAALGPTRKNYSAIKNDDLKDQNLQAFLEDVFRLAKAEALKINAAWYLWHAHLTQGYFSAAAAAAAAAAVVLHRQIIWVKPRLILGRGQYHWKHEPCFMGWVDKHQPPDYGLGNGERTQTTIWEIDGISGSERKEFNHASPKPTGIFSIPIVKHLKAGEIAYEPFAGSGPQFIAAEQNGVRCFGMELEPKFCDVIVKRWENFTGKRAILEAK
jgi:DNA modification methylase